MYIKASNTNNFHTDILFYRHFSVSVLCCRRPWGAQASFIQTNTSYFLCLTPVLIEPTEIQSSETAKKDNKVTSYCSEGPPELEAVYYFVSHLMKMIDHLNTRWNLQEDLFGYSLYPFCKLSGNTTFNIGCLKYYKPVTDTVNISVNNLGVFRSLFKFASFKKKYAEE